MNRIHLSVLWHMHQPQYRDPRNRLLRPALDAVTCHQGLLRHGEACLRNFPHFHATFNLVPSLCMQLEEYASGTFHEPWFALAFKNTDQLTAKTNLKSSRALST